MSKQRKVVVTTDRDRRGVFFGTFISQDDNVVVLKDAMMAVYWSRETQGVLGLASLGPQKGSRITPSVPKITLNGVTSVIDTTVEAQNQWTKQIWD